MRRVGSLILSLALLFGASRLAIAQSGSAIDLVLNEAQGALDRFDYPRAETLSRQVLEVMTSATFAHKQRARIILANAYYPEEAPDKRRREEALGVLRQAVRANLDLILDRNLTWAGLDSLLSEAKRTTFGVALRADAEQVVIGPDSSALVRVRATRPATFRLTVSPATGGPALATDSIADVTDGVLRFKAMTNGRPAFATGDYLLTVVAIDPRTQDSVATTETARITSPPLELATVSTGVDSSKLLPERSKRTGAKGIMQALWVGAGVYAASNLLTADSTVEQKFSPDNKGIPIAVVVSGAVMLFSFTDPGRKLEGNMKMNRQLHDDLATQISTATAENARRINAYRTTITMKTGGR